MQLSGYYQSPGRAAREAARLTLHERYLVLECNGQRQIASLDSIQVSDALGTIPLTLTFSDGGRFVPKDDSAFRQWQQQRHRPSFIHRLERHWRGVGLTLLATIASIAVYILWVLPALSTTIASNIPASIEQKVGQQTLTLLQSSGFSETKLTQTQQQRMERLFSRIIPDEIRRDAVPLQLKIMHLDGGVNAFMLANGTLIMSDDLIQLAKSDDALAAVMLHEIGHHYYRHPMRMLVHSSLISLSYMWLTGDVSGIGDTLLQSAAFVNQMQFSRSMEREADEYAIAQMKEQGLSLAAMGEIYAQLQQSGEKDSQGISLPEWISSHPDMSERIKTILAAEQGK
ncbi:M48 family metallopeptidase [uncultured Cedecea sp.]|uniref:M48 family metallopeptidase n=1 Tax=uncultured Cedecea sp. TaxID=988762 RepID=UPI00262CD9BB|nr:M48 family metallopeptidase [uncultured Cedecea sp.]